MASPSTRLTLPGTGPWRPPLPFQITCPVDTICKGLGTAPLVLRRFIAGGPCGTWTHRIMIIRMKLDIVCQGGAHGS